VCSSDLSAAERGRTGENYLVPGHRVSAAELARLAADCSGIAVTRRTAPGWLMRASSPLATAVAARSHHPLLPTREALRALWAFPTVNSEKASRDLGHRPRPIEETVTNLFAYFRAQGLIGQTAVANGP